MQTAELTAAETETLTMEVAQVVPVCVDCHKPVVKPEDNTWGTGYGMSLGPSGKYDQVVCYACCAYRDKGDMILEGKTILYLTKTSSEPKFTRRELDHPQRADGTWQVSNWQGTLKIKPGLVKSGRHNIARTRRDTWFVGPDGFVWHGVQFGEWSEILHCKRTKERRA